MTSWYPIRHSDSRLYNLKYVFFLPRHFTAKDLSCFAVSVAGSVQHCITYYVTLTADYFHNEFVNTIIKYFIILFCYILETMDSIEKNLGVRTGSTNLLFLKGFLLPSFDQRQPVLTGCNWLLENIWTKSLPDKTSDVANNTQPTRK